MPEDTWPTFWMRISELIRDGKIVTSVKVKEEIDRGNDELTQWIRQNQVPGFYCLLEQDVLDKYAELQQWANNLNRFTTVALNDFANVADAYLVATAAAKKWTLVTYEKPDPLCRRRVKIPDACVALEVDYCNLTEALRRLGVKI